MNNHQYSYYMPTKCFIGHDIIDHKKDLLETFGKKAYIITGRNSSRLNGSLHDVTKALDSVNMNYEIFPEVEENPSLETINKAISDVSDIDFVIGIGGGSPIDAAKAISILLKNPTYDAFDLINTTEKLSHLPVIAVPTTAGTGTEVTQYSIVTDHKAKVKKNLGQSVFPSIAFLDAKYMLNLNRKITINTCIDAFSHIAEAYLNRKANILTDAFCEKGLKIFSTIFPKLKECNLTLEDRENLMLLSTLGGMAISQVGTSLPHGMGYALTYHKNQPHGKANGLLYYGYLKSFKNQNKVNQLLSLINMKSVEELQSHFSALFPVDFSITDDEIRDFANKMAKNAAKLKNHPEDLCAEDIYTIYKVSLF